MKVLRKVMGNYFFHYQLLFYELWIESMKNNLIFLFKNKMFIVNFFIIFVLNHFWNKIRNVSVIFQSFENQNLNKNSYGFWKINKFIWSKIRIVYLIFVEKLFFQFVNNFSKSLLYKNFFFDIFDSRGTHLCFRSKRKIWVSLILCTFWLCTILNILIRWAWKFFEICFKQHIRIRIHSKFT